VRSLTTSVRFIALSKAFLCERPTPSRNLEEGEGPHILTLTPERSSWIVNAVVILSREAMCHRFEISCLDTFASAIGTLHSRPSSVARAEGLRASLSAKLTPSKFPLKTIAARSC